MITYDSRNDQSEKIDSKSCPSKMKSFIKTHPYLFLSIIGGIIIITVVVVVICVTLTNRDEKTEEQEEIEEIPIFPLEEDSKSKVIEIYNDIDTGNKDFYNIYQKKDQI